MKGLPFYCDPLLLLVSVSLVSPGVSVKEANENHIQSSSIPLIPEVSLSEDENQIEDESNAPKAKALSLQDAKILSFFKNLWSQRRKEFKSLDDFLDHMEEQNVVQEEDPSVCSSPVCHFTGRIRVIGGLTWTLDLNNKLSHRFEAIASSLSDMIASLLRGILVDVTYLDIIRIMSPFKTHITVDFDVSFNRLPNRLSSAQSLTTAFNKELYLGSNLGPYTLDPEETHFLRIKHQPYKNQRVHRLVDLSKTQRKIVLNLKRPRELYVSLPGPNVTTDRHNYMLAGGVLSLLSVIIFLGLGAYFHSKRARKNRLNSVIRRDTLYRAVHRKNKALYHQGSHDLSFFERIKIEDSEKSLVNSEDENSTLYSRNISLGDTSSLKFEDVQKSTLKSNFSSRNSSMRRKLDSIKEMEGVGQFELKEIPCGNTKDLPATTDCQYDVIEQL